ncbi:hypothetical protein EGW08_000129 [Elysia chlorotica]|uniref:Uncharacterized protein n=1 Tax=Elysia chlorotica TaxID=188477 RepID=A0A3S1AH91_ELYCH|nr:hypothetical protein EGW08_000129 [Elysia chlorotica]
MLLWINLLGQGSQVFNDHNAESLKRRKFHHYGIACYTRAQTPGFSITKKNPQQNPKQIKWKKDYECNKHYVVAKSSSWWQVYPNVGGCKTGLKTHMKQCIN